MLKRSLILTQGAFAALSECRRGTTPLEREQNTDGTVTVQIESSTYDALVLKQRELNARDLSHAILIMYRAAGGSLRS
jgi:hypothetical protein